MREFEIIETLPGDDNYPLFEGFPKHLYPEDSQRFILGHDPVLSDDLNACFLLLEGSEVLARCAVYENEALQVENKSVCTVGSFECIDDEEVAKALLDHVKVRAKQRGFEKIIGPMEGSTWNNYRFSDHNDSPNFFMEPYHHAYYGKLWQACGFESVANYISNLDDQMTSDAERISKFEELFTSQGAQFRSIDLENLEADLKKLARFNNDAFQDNFLFTPIEEGAFVTKYLQLKKYFDPELIWIVEDASGEIQAISFSIPNYLDPSGKSLIIKSLARKKNTPMKGIGAYLIAKTYYIAQQRNFEKMIHALMIHDNHSVAISNKYEGGNYKSYTLYGIDL
jgi:hypothetical protein